MGIISEVLTFEQFSGQFSARPKQKFSKPYHPRDDSILHNTTTDEANEQEGHVDITARDLILGKIIRTLEEIIGNDNYDDDNLSLVQQAVDQISIDNQRRSSVVSVIGGQGKGKSLLVNALLHRRHLARTSTDGHGCTSSPVQYTYNHLFAEEMGKCSAMIEFKSGSQLQPLIAGFVEQWWNCQRAGDVFSENPQGPEHEELKEEAAASYQVLRWFCNADNDNAEAKTLDHLLEHQNSTQEQIAKHCLWGAKQLRREKVPNGDYYLSSGLLQNEDLGPFLDPYITHDGNKPALWLGVDRTVVSTGCELLKHKVDILDLPGYGDTNRPRTQMTDMHRHRAAYAIIVDVSDRILDEKAVETLLKQSIRVRGARRTILVLTKIDNFLNDPHALEEIIRTRMDGPFPTIRNNLEKSNARVRQLEAADQCDEEAVEESPEQKSRNLYIQYLEDYAKKSYIRIRAETLREKMIEKCKQWGLDDEPIHVFSVSSTQYMQWMNRVKPGKHPILSAADCGVPALRRFLRTVSLEGIHEDNAKIIHTQLPDLMKRLDRVIDDLQQPGYEPIRAAVRLEASRLRDEMNYKGTDKIWKPQYFNWAEADIRKGDRLTALRKTIMEWTNLNHQRLSKGIRQGGIPIYRGKRGPTQPINWNEDLHRVVHPWILVFERKVRKEIDEFSESTKLQAEHDCEHIKTTIRALTSEDVILRNAVGDWCFKQKVIQKAAKNLRKDLHAKFRATMRKLKSEIDAHSTIARMNKDIFVSIAQITNESGNRVKKQKEALYNAFCPEDHGPKDEDFIDRFIAQAIDDLLVALEVAFQKYMTVWSTAMSDYDKELRMFEPPTRAISPQGMAKRARLRDARPEVARWIEEATAKFGQREESEESEEPQAKRPRMV